MITNQAAFVETLLRSSLCYRAAITVTLIYISIVQTECKKVFWSVQAVRLVFHKCSLLPFKSSNPCVCYRVLIHLNILEQGFPTGGPQITYKLQVIILQPLDSYLAIFLLSIFSSPPPQSTPLHSGCISNSIQSLWAPTSSRSLLPVPALGVGWGRATQHSPQYLGSPPCTLFAGSVQWRRP